MSERAETLPRETTGGLDEDDGLAHYARKADIARGAVTGQPITALCGRRFVPHRDPARFPVCPTCKELLATLRDLSDQNGD